MRLYYVLYFGAMGSVSPFINLFYIKNHLSGTEIGVLGTISALVGLISAPFWGRLNDTMRRPRLILQLTLLVNTLAYYFLSRQTVFLDMAVIIGFNALITSCVNPQSQILALAAAHEVGSGYGSVRMWGSLGWAVMATLSGLLVQRTSLISIFYEFGAITTLAILVLFLVKTPPQKSVEQLTAIKSPRIPMRQVLLDMFKNRELTAFMVALVVMWIGSNGTSFESVFLQQLGAKTNLIGTINTVGALVEIPMMLIADRVMRRQGSAKTLLAGVCSYLLASAIIVIHPSIALSTA
jgi:PPP family 3-phenylpropionic acid transporter